MNVLILGKGGREHALAYALSQSKQLTKLYCIPGNPGIAKYAEVIAGDPCDLDFIDGIVWDKDIKLIVPGGENVLLSGIADYYRNSDVVVFGPTLASLAIESSKQFAKGIMDKYHIPTAAYNNFTDYQQAINYIKDKPLPLVIKYNGLASGKGVVIANTYEEADAALQMMLVAKVFGDEGIIIEEYLQGPEFSLICFVHRDIIIPMPIAQDHKRAYTNDLGPNTGGMGAYCPVSIIDEKIINTAMETIMVPMVRALVSEGVPFTGFLYGGLIATKDGPKVIEFNARLGDPEAEVILPKLKTDIITIIMSLLNNKKPLVEWDNNCYLGVVLAKDGYPGKYKIGELPNSILNDPLIFHMGTKIENQQLISNGGRVLCIIGKGKTIVDARADAYQKLSKIDSRGFFYRTDIGWQELK